MKLTPIREFDFGNDLSTMKRITCRSHPTALYLTKNPFLRNLHLIKLPDGFREECPCSFNSLAVIEDDAS